jgi:light-regulated signal transduction histidine kinase (bacteriophytochrome)
LISNALKFTGKRETARIEIGCLTQNGKSTYFIKDNGAGFDMRYADKLFGVFQRLHRFDEFEGTGVGLAIVQRVVQRHGGRIWAQSELDKSSTFYFTLDHSDDHDS